VSLFCAIGPIGRWGAQSWDFPEKKSLCGHAVVPIRSPNVDLMDRKDKLPDVNESSTAHTTLQPHKLPIRSDYVNFDIRSCQFIEASDILPQN
jgi:hypothetical protein